MTAGHVDEQNQGTAFTYLTRVALAAVASARLYPTTSAEAGFVVP